MNKINPKAIYQKNERRRHPRHKVSEDNLIIYFPQGIGRVLNISLGGLLLSWINIKDQKIFSQFSVSLLDISTMTILANIMAEQKEVRPLYGSCQILRIHPLQRMRLCFTRLTSQQHRGLTMLMEQLSGNGSL